MKDSVCNNPLNRCSDGVIRIPVRFRWPVDISDATNTSVDVLVPVGDGQILQPSFVDCVRLNAAEIEKCERAVLRSIVIVEGGQ